MWVSAGLNPKASGRHELRHEDRGAIKLAEVPRSLRIYEVHVWLQRGSEEEKSAKVGSGCKGCKVVARTWSTRRRCKVPRCTDFDFGRNYTAKGEYGSRS